MRNAARRTFLLAALALAPLTAPIMAGEEAAKPGAPAADSMKAARDAWATRQAAMEAVKAAAGEKDKAKAAREASAKASEEFVRAFCASDWNGFDPVADKDLLQSGLTMTGSKALYQDHDNGLAIRAFETLAARIPDAAPAANQSLARAYIASGDLAKARVALDAAVAKGEGAVKYGAHVALGDLLAAQGDIEGAQKSWKVVLDGVPADVDKKDPLARPRGDANLRASLIGQVAPEIDSKTWLEGEAKPLSAFKGNVVLVDFWATWCPPCRQVMPALNALYEEKKKEGLLVLGVTHFYKNGYMPRAGTKDPLKDGVQVKDLTAENYVDHLKEFKANVGITYPFVMTGEDGAESKAYHVSGIPTMVVVDRSGKVAFVKVGSGDETLLKMAVDHALKTGARAAGPAK